MWRLQEAPYPQVELSHDAKKAAFWQQRPTSRPLDGCHSWMAVDPDKLSDEVVERAEKDTGLLREHVPGDPDKHHDPMLQSKMERTAPQFNLRNVPRLEKEIDTEWIEWAGIGLGPSRRGYEEDLAEVRAARHEPPTFEEAQFYSSAVNIALRKELHKVFYVNDWEQWYGEDKKRAAGAMWKYVPPDGEGKRTREWGNVQIVEHKFWKGRLITEEY